MIGTILVFVVLLIVLVIAHEAGHFFVAKRHRMKVYEFGIGFPPRITGINRGGTFYTLNWLPLGGFVRIKGEDGKHTDESDSFAGQAPWRRATVLLAGVFMNAVLAAFLFSIIFSVGFPTIIDNGIPANARISDERFTVVGIARNSAAADAGLEIGDAIHTVENIPVSTVEEIRRTIAGKQTVNVEVQRKDATHSLIVSPRPLAEGGEALLGVEMARTATIRFPIHRAIIEGITQTARMTEQIFLAFGIVIRDVFVQHKIPDELAGPVGIVALTGQALDLGWIHLLQFAAILSLNLAIINIIPFPALDGGRLLFVLFEKIRRKRFAAHTEAVVHQVGFALLILLVLLITYKDIVRLGGGILNT